MPPPRTAQRFLKRKQKKIKTFPREAKFAAIDDTGLNAGFGNDAGWTGRVGEFRLEGRGMGWVEEKE